VVEPLAEYTVIFNSYDKDRTILPGLAVVQPADAAGAAIDWPGEVRPYRHGEVDSSTVWGRFLCSAPAWRCPAQSAAACASYRAGGAPALSRPGAEERGCLAGKLGECVERCADHRACRGQVAIIELNMHTPCRMIVCRAELQLL
jgi:hypothetical protein